MMKSLRLLYYFIGCCLLLACREARATSEPIDNVSDDEKDYLPSWITPERFKTLTFEQHLGLQDKYAEEGGIKNWVKDTLLKQFYLLEEDVQKSWGKWVKENKDVDEINKFIEHAHELCTNSNASSKKESHIACLNELSLQLYCLPENKFEEKKSGWKDWISTTLCKDYNDLKHDEIKKWRSFFGKKIAQPLFLVEEEEWKKRNNNNSLTLLDAFFMKEYLISYEEEKGDEKTYQVLNDSLVKYKRGFIEFREWDNYFEWRGEAFLDDVDHKIKWLYPSYYQSKFEKREAQQLTYAQHVVVSRCFSRDAFLYNRHLYMDWLKDNLENLLCMDNVKKSLWSKVLGRKGLLKSLNPRLLETLRSDGWNDWKSQAYIYWILGENSGDDQKEIKKENEWLKNNISFLDTYPMLKKIYAKPKFLRDTLKIENPLNKEWAKNETYLKGYLFIKIFCWIFGNNNGDDQKEIKKENEWLKAKISELFDLNKEEECQDVFSQDHISSFLLDVTEGNKTAKDLTLKEHLCFIFWLNHKNRQLGDCTGKQVIQWVQKEIYCSQEALDCDIANIWGLFFTSSERGVFVLSHMCPVNIQRAIDLRSRVDPPKGIKNNKEHMKNYQRLIEIKKKQEEQGLKPQLNKWFKSMKVSEKYSITYLWKKQYGLEPEEQKKDFRLPLLGELVVGLYKVHKEVLKNVYKEGKKVEKETAKELYTKASFLANYYASVIYPFSFKGRGEEKSNKITFWSLLFLPEELLEQVARHLNQTRSDEVKKMSQYIWNNDEVALQPMNKRGNINLSCAEWLVTYYKKDFYLEKLQQQAGYPSVLPQLLYAVIGFILLLIIFFSYIVQGLSLEQQKQCGVEVWASLLAQLWKLKNLLNA